MFITKIKYICISIYLQMQIYNLLFNYQNFLIKFLTKTMNNTLTPEQIASELRFYFHENKIAQATIAERLNISQAAVSMRLNAVKPFGATAARRWSEEFGFRPAWLITGEGSMFPAATGEEPAPQVDHGREYFVDLCTSLMREIAEKDARIADLEATIERLKNTYIHTL